MKDYGGEVHVSTSIENGPWRVGEKKVKGGARANPYRQVYNSRWSLIDLLKEILTEIDPDTWNHVSGIVLFRGPIKFDYRVIPKKIRRWFHVADLSTIARLCPKLYSDCIALDGKQVEINRESIGNLSMLRIQ